MWYAFRTVRPVFRERGKIYAEVTGRLTETIGGIRIVKTYTAEKREELVFTTGVHRLFRNVAKTITSVSGITAFGTVVIGAIGLVMIVVGGRAILAGEMTVGDFITYILFTGLMAAPVMQIAAIGTQISEAFAGLDRIHELMEMRTEDDEDTTRAPLGVIDGEVAFEDVSLRIQRRGPGAEGRELPRAGGHDDRARRVERLRQEHADQPGDGVQSTEVRTRPHRWPRSRRPCGCATTARSSASSCRTTSCSTARSRKTSATGVRRRPWRKSAMSAGSLTPTSSSKGSRRSTTQWLASGV